MRRVLAALLYLFLLFLPFVLFPSVHLCPQPGGFKALCNGDLIIVGPLPAGGIIAPNFIVTSLNRVVFQGDLNGGMDTMYELYSVAITGGSCVKINHHLSFDYDVEGFRVDGGGLMVVYRAGRTDDNNWDIYSTPVIGPSSGAKKISAPIAIGAVDPYYQISGDGVRVVYLQDVVTYQEVDLYSVLMNGTSRVRLNAPLAFGNDVISGFTIAGSRVRYAQRESALTTWWLVPIEGGLIMRQLFSNGFESGNTGAWQ